MKKLLFILLMLNIVPVWNPESATFTFTKTAQAQDSLRVLFLGNSYTSYNNLPQMVKDMSAGAGKTLIIDSNTPGGMLISGHLADPTSQSKISQGNWDYVVIQEQSQVPTIDVFRYNDMYPALTDMKMAIEQTNPCAKIITYMTWGRRFGGQQCDPSGTNCSPVFVDFNHMQDTLTSAYLEIGDLLQIQCAPVGVIWKNILNDTTLVLHSADNSHPNLDGSYVAACGIFSSIWKIPAAGTTYTGGLNGALASYYRQKSDQTVFGNPVNWNLYINEPTAGFTSNISGPDVTFTNTSVSATGVNLDFLWDFGDGNTSINDNPQHSYAAGGNYQVRLIAYNCIHADTVLQNVQIGPLGISGKEQWQNAFQVFPNPANDKIQIQYPSDASAELYIFNLSGQLLQMERISPAINSIDVGNLMPGSYLLEIKAGENQYLQKLLIAR